MNKSRSTRSAEIVRRPVVAGIFYPGERAELKDALDRLVGAPARKESRADARHFPGLAAGAARNVKEGAVAIIVPHGAIRWAGTVLAAAYSAVGVRAAAVIAGPSHAGSGARFGIASRGGWETPLGVLAIEGRLARRMLQRVPELERDDAGQREEHAVEVHLPFLQQAGVLGFVPLAIGSCDAVTADRIGQGIARAVAESAPGALLVASANLSCYAPPASVVENDRPLTEAILSLDGESLLQAVAEQGLSMCGAEATAVILAAAKRLGVRQALQVGYKVHQDTASAVSAAAFVLQE